MVLAEVRVEVVVVAEKRTGVVLADVVEVAEERTENMMREERT